MTEDAEMLRLCELAQPPIDPSMMDKVTKLNLPECGLTSLPANLGQAMPNLSILFCPKNNFDEVPVVIGSCPKLQVR